MSDRSSVFYRKPSHRYPVAVAGDGPWIVDSEGRRRIDACGGAAVSSLGHCHPEITAALREQLDRIDYVHTSFYTTEATEALAAELASTAPPGLSRVLLLSGGSEAVESALKLARQAAVERGEGRRTTVIARHQSYHGNTLGALSVSGNLGRRQLYAPLLFDAAFIAPCFPYRYAEPGESPEAYGRRAADELERMILARGPDTILAFIAETVVGATAGAVAPAPGYLRRIREICDRHGVLLILDEVMCGMGRTGTLHACEQEGVTPDILVVAKGLGGGYAPIAAVFASEAIHDAVVAGSGALQNGFTYMGHPLACAAALAVQRVIRRDGLLARVREEGTRLHQALLTTLGNHPNVGDIRGRGLFLAVEFVRDRETREPFDPALKAHEAVKQAAMEAGLLVYAMPGTIDGERGNHILLAPPYTIDADIVGRIAGMLGVAVERGIAPLLRR